MTDRNINQMMGVSAAQEAIGRTLKVSAEATSDLIEAKQDASQDALRAEAEGNFSAAGHAIRTKKLQPKQEVKRTDRAKEVQQSVLVRKEDADDLADQFSRRQGNREYRLDTALLSQLVAEELGAGIHENSPPDKILSLIRKRMTIRQQSPDVAMVDKAFEFLLEVMARQVEKATGVDQARLTKISQNIKIAKDKHFTEYQAIIEETEKIIGAVDAVVITTGQNVQDTLNEYRDIVHNAPDFQTLRKKYEFKGYKATLLELKGLSSYLGGNFKRTNLESPELAQLASAARKMQAWLNSLRFLKIRSITMEKYTDSKIHFAT